MKRKYLEYALLLLAIVALLGLINAIRVDATHQTNPATHESPLVPTAQELLTLTNAERTRAGSPPLLLDERLNGSAQAKADEIAATGVFEHVGSTGKQGYSYIPAVDIGCTYVSENLVQSTDPKHALYSWMQSKAHREALLDNRYDLVGFAVAGNSTVQHFCDLP